MKSEKPTPTTAIRVNPLEVRLGETFRLTEQPALQFTAIHGRTCENCIGHGSELCVELPSCSVDEDGGLVSFIFTRQLVK